MASTATRTQNKIAKLTALAEHPNTPEHEAALARFALGRLLAKVAEAGGDRPSDSRWYGAKYDHSGTLSTVQIAKLICDEVKLLRKIAKSAGTVPDEAALKTVDLIGDMPAQIKISIRVPYHGAVYMHLTNVPADWGFVGARFPDEHRRYDSSPALLATTAALKDLMNAHDHNGSDVMTDYFDRRFYGSVSVERPEDIR